MKTSIISLSFVLAGLASAQVPAWGQCGGNNHSGSTSCVSGYTCSFVNEWYSQCIPGGSGSTPTSTIKISSSSIRTSTSSTKTSSIPTSITSSTTVPNPNPGTPPAGLVGFATQNGGTTGGGNAAPVTVTSCAALKAAVLGTAPAVVKISGILSGCGVIDIGSNKSLLGVGSNSGMTGGGVRVRLNKNVIIRNLKFSPPAKGDAVAIDESTNVWIDHCDFSSVGLIGGKDDYDGLLDITHAANFVTVSWNKFRNHWKGSLVGHSDSNGSEDRGFLKVTYHHNHFDNVNSRTPSLRFGTAHIFNNLYTDIPTSGINSRMGAVVLVEGNVFNNVNLAIVTDLDSDVNGFATERNNIFSGTTTTRITATGSFTPPYAYSVQAVTSVQSIVTSGSGTGIISV